MTNTVDDDVTVERVEPVTPVTTVIVAGDVNTVPTVPRRVTLRPATGRYAPWRSDARVRAGVGEVIHLMVGGFRRSDLRALLNLYLRNHNLPEVSARTVDRYLQHAAELYAESEGISLGEVRAMFADAHAQAEAIIEDRTEHPNVRVAALKVKLENADRIARLSGHLDSRGDALVQVNINPQPIEWREGSDSPAFRAALAILHIGQGDDD